MRRSMGAFGSSLALGASLLATGPARAQQAATPTAGATPAAGGGTSGAAASGAGTSGSTGGTAGAGAGTGSVVVTPPSVSYPVYPGGVAPVPAGGVLGGGNVQGSSSSRPITGNEQDGFDLGQRSGGGGTARGSENGNIIFAPNGPRGEGVRGIGPTRVPNSHLVKKGDTLWDICDYYFHNPYEWPRIWSMNPSLKNPHWIEPGQNVLLRKGGGGQNDTVGARGSSLRPQTVHPKAVFMRDETFIEEGNDFDWGKIEGAREERMFLANDDEVYLRWTKDRDIKPGAEYSIFHDVKKTKFGTLVELQGQVKIDTVDTKNKLARGRVHGTTQEIERGAHFGPVPSRFDIVAPVANDVDAEGTLFTALAPGAL
ncbi:MAG: LysM peptidoglycan-binding domain-containing protein, partial [Proteobacteria bacterium]